MTLSTITSKDVTTKDYSTAYESTRSSLTACVDMAETLGRILSVSSRRDFLRRTLAEGSLLPSFESDISSLHPFFAFSTNTLFMQEYHNNAPYSESIEHDVVVRMPPVKEYTMRAMVKSVGKATPLIIEPENGYL